MHPAWGIVGEAEPMSEAVPVILFVCTGNTCRSPMAEAIARHLLSGNSGIEVSSAGVSAGDGNPATPEAEEAMERMSLSIAGHRSRQLTAAMIRRATVIYTMTEAHRADILAAEPAASSKTFTLDPLGPVPDPIGSPIGYYLETAAVLSDLVARRLEEFES